MPVDQDFERAFATLAHAELSQRVPGLVPYLIGFQTVEQDEDASRAVGIFGFRIGDQWYYCPVFWLNGKLKGFDCLYIVSQDLFVPLQEAYVNYVTNKRPYVFGDSTSESLGSLGVQQPDFEIFRRSPLTKGAAQQAFKHVKCAAWCKPEALYVLPNDTVKYGGVSDKLSLPNVMREMPAEFTVKLLETMSKSAEFAEAVYTFYDKADIARSALHVSRKVKSAETELVSANKPEKVEVLYADGETEMDESLTAAQREALLKGDVLVSDSRQALPVIYNEPRAFQKPSCAGVWTIYMQDKSTKNCFVGTGPIAFSAEPTSSNIMLVVDLDSKAFSQRGAGSVLAKSPPTTPDWNEFYDGLADVSSLKTGDVATIITDDKSCTIPVHVRKATTGEDGSITLCVAGMRDVVHGAKYPNVRQHNCTPSFGYDCVPYPDTTDRCTVESEDQVSSADQAYRCAGTHIRLVDGTEDTYVIGGTIIISKSRAKALLLKPESRKINFSSYDQWSVLNTAAQHDLDNWIFSSGLKKLAAKYDGDSEIELSYGSTSERMGFGPAMRKLIVDVGLSEKQARTLLHKARVEERVSCLVKGAASTPSLLQTGAIPAYNDMYNAPTVYPESAKADLGSDVGTGGLDPQAAAGQAQQLAMTAAQSGQKEVFDMAALGSLVRSANVPQKISELVKDIIIGNDRIGRILFLFYWHNDQFVERFGDADLTELEDLLQETFKSTGELVLYLKQKSLEQDTIATDDVISI